jgi:DNA-binding CsgD family transcriptional regulator
VHSSHGVGSIELFAAANDPSYDAAHALWKAGEYLACLDRLAHATDIRSLVLRGRALLRLGRPRDLIELLHDATGELDDSPDSVLVYVVRALAFSRTRDHGSARVIVEELKRRRGLDATTSAEIARCATITAWMRGDTAEAERELIAASVDPAPAARAAYYQLRSWISARREQYSEQARTLVLAAELLLKAPGDDVGLLADITRTLATLNRDLSIIEVAPIVEELISTIPWTPDLTVAHFNALRDFGWHHALHGRYLPGLRLLHEAERIAPTPAWRVLALLDRAQLARWAGEPASSSASLFAALSLESTVAWERTDDEERNALLIAAEVCAEVDALRAHGLLERFEELVGGFAPRMIARGDRRLLAHRRQVAGAVQHALGNDRAAVESCRAAYVIFAEVGYRWRAAMCAARLHALTNERSWLSLGADLIQDYPRGSIARELAVAGADVDEAVRRLTPREREVLRGLLDGLRVARIAGRLNISPHTAKHYATAVYRAFGVDSQSELMAEAKRRRLA